MSDHYETRCPSCGGSDEQGCYTDCPTTVITALTAENKRLRATLEYALENGVGVQYWGDDDDCGTHKCCGEVSYKPHAPECWVIKVRAALEKEMQSN